MRVLVCGGREYADRDYLFMTLDIIHSQHPVDVVIEGCARGADSIAEAWAVARSIELWHFPADWKTFGPRAGPARNLQMLVVGEPDLVVAFPGGRGTANMVDIATNAGVKVWRA